MAVERIYDVSGGIQTATSSLIRKSNEMEDAENFRFDKEIGSAVGRDGYIIQEEIASDEVVMGVHEAKYDNGAIVFTASSDGDNTIIRAYNPSESVVETVIDDLPPDVYCQFLDHLNEVYVAGMSDDGERIDIHNIRYDGEDFTVSTDRNLMFAPKAAFIGENSGKLYAANVEVNGEVFPDRAYESSPPMGAITYVRGAQYNTIIPTQLVSVIPKMTSNTAPSGVASASSTANANTQAFAAFDKVSDSVTPNTRWITVQNTTTGWLRYDFGDGNQKIISVYSVSAAGPIGSINRAPRTWTFQGSQDGTAWTVLDTQTDVPAFGYVGETRYYSMSNTTAYRYYRINITANHGSTEYTAISEMDMYAILGGPTNLRHMPVDSVRYIKEGMVVDIYKAGGKEKLRTITVGEVNKSDDTFNYLPFEQSGMAFNATEDWATISAGEWSQDEFFTGSPVILKGTGVAPVGLSFDTTYYAVRVEGDDTRLRFAETYDQALIGDYINIAGVGSGSFTLSVSYIFDDNDEIWLHDRNNPDDLSVLWNTDYRTEQTSDYLRIPPGASSDTAITGWTKSNNRLILFTETSTHQWDNANFIPLFEDFGCVSHNTIKNSGTWLIWLDAEGKIRVRDGASGQDEVISRFIKNKYLDAVPPENFRHASASMFDGNYKLNVGLVGNRYWRLVYNFDSNNFWRETHVRNPKLSFDSRMSGGERLYFLTDTNDQLVLCLDEEGDLDIDATIPCVLQYGRRNMGTFFEKGAIGAYVMGKNVSGAQMFVRGNADRDWRSIGQLEEPVTRIVLGDNKEIKARDFDFKISMHQKGDRPIVEGLEFYYNFEETNFG